jgi:hypothetical protein
VRAEVDDAWVGVLHRHRKVSNRQCEVVEIEVCRPAPSHDGDATQKHPPSSARAASDRQLEPHRRRPDAATHPAFVASVPDRDPAATASGQRNLAEAASPGVRNRSHDLDEGTVEEAGALERIGRGNRCAVDHEQATRSGRARLECLEQSADRSRAFDARDPNVVDTPVMKPRDHHIHVRVKDIERI